MTWLLEAFAKWGIEPQPGCHLCEYLSHQVERLQAENMRLSVELADGAASASVRADLAIVNDRLAEANEARRHHKGDRIVWMNVNTREDGKR